MRVVSWSIAAPTLPAEVLNQAKGVSREKALTFGTDRLHILVSCAVEVERWIGRALWPGNRTAFAVVRVSDATEDVPLLPMLPDTTGVHARGSLSCASGATRPKTGPLRPTRNGRPAGCAWSGLENTRLPSRPSRLARYRQRPIEGVSRLFAIPGDFKRPGDLSEIAGEQQVLSGAMMRSGLQPKCFRAITLNYL